MGDDSDNDLMKYTIVGLQLVAADSVEITFAGADGTERTENVNLARGKRMSIGREYLIEAATIHVKPVRKPRAANGSGDTRELAREAARAAKLAATNPPTYPPAATGAKANAKPAAKGGR